MSMGTPRKQPESVRSGRIKAENSAGSLSLPIVKRGGDYRIFNSGDADFNVVPDGGTPIPLRQKCAVDAHVSSSITVERSAAGAVEGTYDIVGVARSIRGGRFKASVNTTTGITIAFDRGVNMYRILNSGKNDFKVNFQGTNVTVRQRHSIDVAAGASITITNAAATGSANVQGIYDFLDVSNEIRSGRFKIKKDAAAVPPIDPINPHPIINTTGAAAVGYRIFNTGENPIVILEGATTIHTLNPDESLDFKVSAAREIFVKSTASNKPIEGIFDYLGPV
jgi:hypothetical protein